MGRREGDGGLAANYSHPTRHLSSKGYFSDKFSTNPFAGMARLPSARQTNTETPEEKATKHLHLASQPQGWPPFPSGGRNGNLPHRASIPDYCRAKQVKTAPSPDKYDSRGSYPARFFRL